MIPRYISHPSSKFPGERRIVEVVKVCVGGFVQVRDYGTGKEWFVAAQARGSDVPSTKFYRRFS